MVRYSGDSATAASDGAHGATESENSAEQWLQRLVVIFPGANPPGAVLDPEAPSHSFEKDSLYCIVDASLIGRD